MLKNGRIEYCLDSDTYMIEDHELLCGDCFNILVNGSWKSVRIEMDDNNKWYLDGEIQLQTFNNLEAEIFSL